MSVSQSTILVVDDQPANLKMLISFLQMHDFKIRVADNGERAIEILKNEPVDLVLLDVMMPGINGFTTCKQIKDNKDTAEIPIIFMTALDSLEDKVAGFEAGGVDYITKPFQQVEVLTRVNTHLTLRKKEFALQQALAEIKTLSGILPICSFCKKIRDEEGYWQKVEQYIADHSEVLFRHGMCDECMKKNYHQTQSNKK